jgi:acyl carrier protein
MDVETIRAEIKRAIQQVTGVEADTISDSASYVGDLGLDSLAVLEIAVAVENKFKFQAADEEMAAVRTVEDTVNLVKRSLYVDVA